ncbi:MAG: carbohydrate-binding protein [Pirellulales bacterium]|nr:carbohydrate-binding protein [Pirellulales bacterium]
MFMDISHSFRILSLMVVLAGSVSVAREIHVATDGHDFAMGSAEKPFKTISAAAQQAQPGDTITVHAGVYRERVDPPRGGTSPSQRITYRAADGEQVVITGSDSFKTWEKVSGDTWKLVLPNSYFGAFNPYAEKVHGDWFSDQGRGHHRGNVYRSGKWLAEAPNLDAVMKPAGENPMWFATVDGVAADGPLYLMNIVTIKPETGIAVTASKATQRKGTRNALCSEGGECVGFISQGDWLRYDGVDFGAETSKVTIRAAANSNAGGVIELRDGRFDGPLLGICEVQPTGDWQKWQDFTAAFQSTQVVKNLYLVFKSLPAAKAETKSLSENRPRRGEHAHFAPRPSQDGAGPQNEPIPDDSRSGSNAANKNTTIYAQFPGVDPNEGAVEVCIRPTVFTPEKTNIDYITIRGFELRNAATNWAAPTMGQVGLITAYWCKGWIIEDNEICYSRCGGVALGKYSDQWDGARGTTEGYYLTIEDALNEDGWSRDMIGSHVVRNNHIHHCGEVGIVGSLGCAFSRVEGNDIHDCNMQGIWGGAEMAGIKFHGAIDVVITNNHIHHNGHVGGLWLDWMAQGTQITHNLFHDNQGHDLFTEVDHGPFLVANNLFLSPGAYLTNSEGAAFAHNLVAGELHIIPDSRRTPFMKAHSTETIGLHNCPVGDARWYNNILARGANLGGYNQAGPDWPCLMEGNLFAKGGTPSRFETNSVVKSDFDIGARLTQKDDGWYLQLKTDPNWAVETKRQLVTTELLGKAVVPNQGFTNPDDSPLKIDTDYFGQKQDATNPFPGPFKTPVTGEIKVWPKP